MIEPLFVAFIIALAAVYALWRISKSWQRNADKCSECNGCKNGKSLKNEGCNKKTAEKFGHYK